MSLNKKHTDIVTFISALKDFDPLTNSFSIPLCFPDGKPVRLKLIRTANSLYFSDGGENAAHIMQALFSSSSVVARLRTQNLLKALTRRTPISVNETELRSNVTYFNTRKDLEDEISYFVNACTKLFEAQSAMLKGLEREAAAEAEGSARRAVDRPLPSHSMMDRREDNATLLHAA